MSDKTTFNIGDTVRLKSGGPIMTVGAVDEAEGNCWCKWFPRADSEKAAGADFKAAMLKAETPA